MVKNPLANEGNIRDTGLIPGWGRSPGGGYGQLSPGEPHGQRSQVGYSLWSRKESDKTEQLSTS